jgi:hypothetical protein
MAELEHLVAIMEEMKAKIDAEQEKLEACQEVTGLSRKDGG